MKDRYKLRSSSAGWEGELFLNNLKIRIEPELRTLSLLLHIPLVCELGAKEIRCSLEIRLELRSRNAHPKNATEHDQPTADIQVR